MEIVMRKSSKFDAINREPALTVQTARFRLMDCEHYLASNEMKQAQSNVVPKKMVSTHGARDAGK